MNILIVNFHYVTDEIFAFPGIAPVSKSEFKSIVEMLAREREPISLDMIVRATTEGGSLPEQGFLVTFDDGLQCQFANAEPILEDFGIDAAYFVNTHQIITDSLLPVHKLQLLRSQFDSVEILESCYEKLGRDYNKIVDQELRDSRQYRYDDESSRSLKYLLNFVLSPSQTTETVAWLFDKYGLLNPSEFYLSKDTMRALALKNKLGAHSHHHYPLGKMCPSAVARDIRLNIDLLKEVCGTNICSISYPYGGAESLGLHVTKAAEEIGILVGFTMARRSMTSLHEPLLLPRFDVRDLYPIDKTNKH